MGAPAGPAAHTTSTPVRVGILTISDACHRGERDDASGRILMQWVTGNDWEATRRGVVPDEADRITATLVHWADAGLDVIVTTGGTGLGPRDVTPEATRPALDRPAPGIAEAIRRRGGDSTPFSALSRGLAGVRGRTLVVNLPGSPGGVRDGVHVLGPLVPHAVALLRGDNPEHTPPEAAGGGEP